MTEHNPITSQERLCPYTSFVVTSSSDGVFEVHLGQASEALDDLLRTCGATHWACLTVGRPDSAHASGLNNQKRLFELKSYLLALGLAALPVRTASKKTTRSPQDGFLVIGIAPDQAIRIGSMLDQDAIAAGSIGMPSVAVACDPIHPREAAHFARGGTDGPEFRPYLNAHIEKLWNEAEFTGIWVRESDLPEKADEDDLDILADKVDPDRLAALEAGDELTDEEGHLWREAWIARALADDGDADRVPGYAISRVSLKGRQDFYVLILATGYSFSDIERWIEGEFASLEEALAHVSASGWHS